MGKRVIASLLLLLFAGTGAYAQVPRMSGIAKMTFRISSFELAEAYYGDFLGFDKAFEYDTPQGRIVSYKVNDRQFLEFLLDPAARDKERFVSLTIATPDLEAMHAHIAAHGYRVTPITTDGAGNRVFMTADDRGEPIEFSDMNAQGLHARSAGKYLSPRRISDHIIHAGLHLNQIEERPRFWTEVLGFKELTRCPEDRSQPVNLIYLAMPGNTESIESYSSSPDAPAGSGFEHPCLVTMNMQRTLDELRRRNPDLPHTGLGIGRTRRWIYNITNSDGLKVEFTEPYTIR